MEEEITTEQGSFLHKIWELSELEAVWGIICQASLASEYMSREDFSQQAYGAPTLGL